MRKTTLGLFPFLLLALLVAMFSCAPQEEQGAPAGEAAEEAPAAPAPALSATAVLSGAEGSAVTGTVDFEQAEGGVQVNAEISGLAPGEHGFHIHETGDCSGEGFQSAGGHFNPEGVEHGGPTSPVHHAGDLGNIEADDSGNASYSAKVSGITLEEGPTSVVGRAVIVHQDADDLTSQPSGNAGPRVACGVIELAGAESAGEETTEPTE